MPIKKAKEERAMYTETDISLNEAKEIVLSLTDDKAEIKEGEDQTIFFFKGRIFAEFRNNTLRLFQKKGEL